MNELHGNGRIDDRIAVRLAEAGGEQQQVGAGAFAAGREEMFGGGISPMSHSSTWTAVGTKPGGDASAMPSIRSTR